MAERSVRSQQRHARHPCVSHGSASRSRPGSSRVSSPAASTAWSDGPSLPGVDVLALTDGIGEQYAALLTELKTSLSWWGAFETIVVPALEEGMIARLCRRQSAVNPSVAIG